MGYYPEEQELEVCEDLLQEVKEELTDALEEKDFERIVELISEHFLHDNFSTHDEVMDEGIYLPEWEMSIKVVVQDMNENMANLGFYVNAPCLERELYECSIGVGTDLYAAISNSTENFLLCFMSAIDELQNEGYREEVKSEFLGRERRWKLYESDVIIVGKRAKNFDSFDFWETLGEDVRKRLGNQDLVYIKIYGAKINDTVIGECRIQDVKIEEISKKIEEIVKTWDVEGFSSNKQFFFLKREDEESPSNQYFGEEGREKLKANVLQALKTLLQCDTEEKFDHFEESVSKYFDDITLAQECKSFLPEICSEHAFQEKVEFSEEVMIRYPDDGTFTLFKSQLRDYYDLKEIFFEILNEGLIEDPDRVYRDLISMSASYRVIQDVQKDNQSIEGAKFAPLLYNVDEGFEIR